MTLNLVTVVSMLPKSKSYLGLGKKWKIVTGSFFFGKLHLFWFVWQACLYFFVSIELLTSNVSVYYHLKIIVINDWTKPINNSSHAKL